MYCTWVEEYTPEHGTFLSDCELVSRFASSFLATVDRTVLVDFICAVFLIPAQYILASLDWELLDLRLLPRVSPAMTGWGLYADILYNPSIGQLGNYVGSATGQQGLAGRLGTYASPPGNGKRPLHHETLWKADWQVSFHQLADMRQDSGKHRVYSIFAETFGMALTDSLDPEAIGPYNLPGTSEFIRNFQLEMRIPIRENILRLNRALSMSQGIRIDQRFINGKACSNCPDTKGPFLPSAPGRILDISCRFCRKCRDYSDNYDGSVRPSAMAVRYDHWKAVDGIDDCQVCKIPFSESATKSIGPKGQAYLLTDIALKVCKACHYCWETRHFILPIEGLHIPSDHPWACDRCKTTTSRWFHFENPDLLSEHAAKYYCWDCHEFFGRELFGSYAGYTSFRKLFAKHPVITAGFPTRARIMELSQQMRPTTRRAIAHWTKNNFGIDLTSTESCKEQRRIDLAKDNLLLSESSSTDDAPLQVRKDAAKDRNGINKRKRKRASSEE